MCTNSISRSLSSFHAFLLTHLSEHMAAPSEKESTGEASPQEGVTQGAATASDPISKETDVKTSVASGGATKDGPLSEAEPDGAVEPPSERALAQAELVAKQDYSVFTTSQKRALILIGSFAGWLSPMSGSIYYPALNQVSSLPVYCCSVAHRVSDCQRSACFELKSEYHCHHLSDHPRPCSNDDCWVLGHGRSPSSILHLFYDIYYRQSRTCLADQLHCTSASPDVAVRRK